MFYLINMQLWWCFGNLSGVFCRWSPSSSHIHSARVAKEGPCKRYIKKCYKTADYTYFLNAYICYYTKFSVAWLNLSKKSIQKNSKLWAWIVNSSFSSIEIFIHFEKVLNSWILTLNLDLNHLRYTSWETTNTNGFAIKKHRFYHFLIVYGLFNFFYYE